ncbi:hypothetical protein EVD33_03930 [Bacteroidales bacterium SW292]|nr:hypothetical protein [Bacteroidales bacterium SW292]
MAKKDYSGKQLSAKAHRVLLIVNVVVFLAAVALLVGSIRHDETVSVVAASLVMLVSAGNAFMSGLRLKGKKL